MLKHALVCFVFLWTFIPSAQADFLKQFTDPTDGRLDASQWLLDNAAGFMPMPIIITDPAVGYGGGVALTFFHKNKELKPDTEDPNSPLSLPPSASGVVAIGTKNGTKGGALFHMGVWKQDTIRYTGALAYFDANIDSYHLSLPNGNEIPIGTNIEGGLIMQQLRFRLNQSPWFLGLRYTFFDSESRFTIGDLPHDKFIPILKLKDGGLSALLSYDGRDNLFSPNTGLYGAISYTKHEHYLGSDNSYDNLDFGLTSYGHLSQRWLGALRLTGAAVNGDAPYYALPYIDMRGIPSMRYQGQRVLTLQGELRYDFDERWSGVAFGGLAQAFNADQGLGDTNTRYSKGLGFRYLLARRFNFRTGIDIAQGPEDTTIHFIMGSGWNDY